MKIYQLHQGIAPDYFSSELAKYVELLCGEKSEIISGDGEDGIRLGLFEDFGLSDDRVKKADLDDAFQVEIEDLKGYIAGSNIRSILYGIYEFLRKSGCCFLRSGKDGDYVPKITLDELKALKASIKICFDTRYRFDCIEGSVDYEVLRDHVYWLPKIGYNGYMLQATSPFVWYERWYDHYDNPYMEPENLTVEQADEITLKLEQDIKRAGLTCHSVGHEWQMPIFGLYGEHITQEELDAAGVTPHLALVNGERTIRYGEIRCTNLCYSDPVVREKAIAYFLDYMRRKPYVDYLHIWLADHRNNYCECDLCKDLSVSDIQVDFLNALDNAFTENGIDVRIEFEMYNGSCWAPEKKRFNNPDRFVFSPAIRQDYISGYTKYNPDAELPKRIHNNYNVPNDFSLAVNFAKEWQKVFEGDNFFFDYHLYTDHYVDPGYCQVAHRVSRDMKLLKSLGTQGMMTCATPRAHIPNSLPMYLCGHTLMNTSINEEEAGKIYFDAAYGKDSDKAYEYLSTLSDLFQPDLLRDVKLSAADEMLGETGMQVRLLYMDNPEALEKFKKIHGVILDFIPTIKKNIAEADCDCRRKSWELLYTQVPFIIELADALALGAAGDLKSSRAMHDSLKDHLARAEADYMPDLDYVLLTMRLRSIFGLYVLPSVKKQLEEEYEKKNGK